MSLRIIPLPIGKIKIDKSMLTYRRNIGEKIWIPYYSWYIEGTKENVLVDTGVSAEDALKIRGKTEAVRFENITYFEDALKSVGLTPEKIDIVIQTHLAYDHCGNTWKCKNARVIVQLDELKFAQAPHPLLAEIYYPELLRNLKIQTVQGDVKGFLPGIDLIFVPGHAPGSQAVCVSTEAGKACISGFCSIKDNFVPHEEDKPYYPVTPSGIHTDPIQAFESALKIKGIADILIPQHDPSFLKVAHIP